MKDGERAQQDPELPPSASGSGQCTPAAARREYLHQVRAAVRTQLIENRRRRQRFSYALSALRQDLSDFRTRLRSRLRETGIEAASRKAPLPAAAPPAREPQPTGSSPAGVNHASTA